MVDTATGVVRLPPEMVRRPSTRSHQLFIAGAVPSRDVVLDRRSGPFFNPSGASRQDP